VPSQPAIVPPQAPQYASPPLGQSRRTLLRYNGSGLLRAPQYPGSHTSCRTQDRPCSAELPPTPGDVRRFQRLNAVAGPVAHFQRAMMMDIDQAAKAMRDEEMQAEIEDFLEGFNQPTYRGMRDQRPAGRYLV
jgi:hypothetical protein